MPSCYSSRTKFEMGNIFSYLASICAASYDPPSEVFIRRNASTQLPSSEEVADNLNSSSASTSASTSHVPLKLITRPRDLKQLNGSVWEFHKPLDGVQKMDIIFFHGAQLSSDEEAFWKTWLSRDDTKVWPKVWLAEAFPSARILSVSYDSSVRKYPGQKDVYQTIENLMSDIILSPTCMAGQKCPVILVGHCFGGIIIKDFLVKCHGFSTSRDPEAKDAKKMKMFLQNCKAIFYYSTPNTGTTLMEGLAYQDYIIGNVNQPIVDFLEILSQHTARINSDFMTLNKSILKLATRAIGETLDTKLQKSTRRIRVVSEASARQDVDSIYWAPDADHFDVSKAKDNSTCCIFTELHDLVANHYINASPSTPTEFKSALNFSNDDLYVPLENTINEIDAAFRKSQVVVLYGDSGMGKSSLARHYALRFEEKHVQEASSSASELSQFPLRPTVVFVTCGEKAKVTSKQQFLLIKFDVEYPQKDCDGLDEASIQELLRTKLKEHIGDRQALVVLDDVWQRELVTNLLVRGPKLKYLITARNRDLWRDNAEVIGIEQVDIEHGRRILGNYAKWRDHELFEGQADELIREVGCHPLALATLGTVLQTKKRQSLHEWQNLKRDFLEYLKIDDDSCYPTLFDEGYPRSLYAAMMLMVNGLDDDSKTVLYAINIFEHERIPESLVELFLSCTHPDVFKSFYVNIEKLERLCLVRREEETRASRSPVELPFSKDGNEDEDEAILGDYRYYLSVSPARSSHHEITSDVFVIHDLRRKFLSENKSSTNGIISFLFANRESFNGDPDRRSKYDLAASLCSFNGQSSVRAMARTWLPMPDLVPEETFHMIPDAFLAKLVCSVRQQASSWTAAIEVFSAFVIHSRIDLHNVPVLLVEPESNRHAIELICYLLSRARDDSFESILIDTGGSLESLERSTVTGNGSESVLINIGGSIERLTQHLSPNGGIKSLPVLFIILEVVQYRLSYPDRVSIPDFMSHMFATNLLDMVFMNLDTKDGPHSVRFDLSLQILDAFLGRNSQGLSGRELLVIVDKITCPKNLDIIARLFFELQEISPLLGVQTMFFLFSIEDWCDCPPCDAAQVLIKNLTENPLQTTRLFEAVLRWYCFGKRKEWYHRNDDSDCWMFEQFDIDKCSIPDNHFLRFAAMHLPSLLSSAVMPLLHEMRTLSRDKCGLFIERLERVPPTVTEIVILNDLQIDVPVKFLDKVVEQLDRTIKEVSQIHALRALYVFTAYIYASDPENGIQVKMIETEHLLERVIMCLSESTDMEWRCRWAAALLQRLISIQGTNDIVEPILQGPLFVSLSGKAGHFNTCLERVAMLLREGVMWKIQKIGLEVLLSIARLAFNFATSGNSMLIDVLTISDLLGRAVKLLVPDVESIQETAVEGLAIIAQFRFDERLGLDVHLGRLATPYLLKKLATSLSREKLSTSPYMCERAARIIQSLATQPAVGKVIAQFRDSDALIIEKLRGLLELNQTIAEGYELKSMQEAAVEALIRLPVRAKIERRIQKMHIAPDILSRLYSLWGWTNVMRKDYEAALGYLNRALEVEPDRNYRIPFLLQERGIVRRYLDDLDGALEDLDQALEIDGNKCPDCLKHRGLVKYKSGDKEGARKDAERAVAIRARRSYMHTYKPRDVYDLCLGDQSVEFLGYKLR